VIAQTVVSDGLSLHVEVDGPDDGPVAVLVHGFAGSVGLAWRATGVLDRLTSLGVRTVAYDARGHGRSDKPHAEAAYGDDRMADDLIRVADAHHADLVVGYSMGAAVALHALAAGLRCRGAVIGAAPPAVLAWTTDMDATRAAAIRALRAEGEGDDVMRSWIAQLEALGEDREALACVLARHSPVFDRWVAGNDDTMAAPPHEIAGKLVHGEARSIPGDHFTTPSTAVFAALVADLAHGVRREPSCARVDRPCPETILGHRSEDGAGGAAQGDAAVEPGHPLADQVGPDGGGGRGRVGGGGGGGQA
jgi:pimeloyl-ACP methyl ester carboxylesterase